LGERYLLADPHRQRAERLLAGPELDSTAAADALEQALQIACQQPLLSTISKVEPTRSTRMTSKTRELVVHQAAEMHHGDERSGDGSALRPSRHGPGRT
jgi:hypothetical protein